jgi:hypothetical protein
MCLLDDYKRSHKSGVRIPQQWGDDEETQLRELYEEFKAAAGKMNGQGVLFLGEMYKK